MDSDDIIAKKIAKVLDDSLDDIPQFVQSKLELARKLAVSNSLNATKKNKTIFIDLFHGDLFRPQYVLSAVVCIVSAVIYINMDSKISPKDSMTIADNASSAQIQKSDKNSEISDDSKNKTGVGMVAETTNNKMMASGFSQPQKLIANNEYIEIVREYDDMYEVCEEYNIDSTPETAQLIDC